MFKFRVTAQPVKHLRKLGLNSSSSWIHLFEPLQLQATPAMSCRSLSQLSPSISLSQPTSSIQSSSFSSKSTQLRARPLRSQKIVDSNSAERLQEGHHIQNLLKSRHDQPLYSRTEEFGYEMISQAMSELHLDQLIPLIKRALIRDSCLIHVDRATLERWNRMRLTLELIS
jgi:hypothetical protein